MTSKIPSFEFSFSFFCCFIFHYHPSYQVSKFERFLGELFMSFCWVFWKGGLFFLSLLATIFYQGFNLFGCFSEMCRWVKAGVSKRFCKKPKSRPFKLYEPHVSVVPAYCFVAGQYVSEWTWLFQRLYLWALKCVFHKFFISQHSVFLLMLF